MKKYIFIHKIIFSRELKCPQACTVEYLPMCGTDGKTYGNPCFLQVARCKSDGEITLAHPGPCGTYKLLNCCIKNNEIYKALNTEQQKLNISITFYLQLSIHVLTNFQSINKLGHTSKKVFVS